MNLVEVDVVGLEAAEAGLDSVHDVAAGGSYVVAARADTAVDLGGDDDVFASDVEIFLETGRGPFRSRLRSRRRRCRRS